MRTLLIIAFVSLALACSPQAPPDTSTEVSVATTAAADIQTEFMAPSGNLGCIYTPAGGTDVYETPDGAAELKCDRAEPSYVRVTLPEHGVASVMTHVGEASCCSGEALAYGAHWSAGPFQCDMTEAGLTCSSADGHGFTLSRDRVETR